MKKYGKGFTPLEIVNFRMECSFPAKRFFSRKIFRPRFLTGFTLTELLVVIAIIGILTSMIYTSVVNARQKARIAKAQTEVKQISNAIALLETDTESWPRRVELPADLSGNEPKIPNTIEAEDNNEIWDLSNPGVGLTGDADGKFNNWQGPYMATMTDPWGNPYFLDTDYDTDQSTTSEKMGVVIGSFGPNGVGPNLYDSDDIIYIIYKEP